MKKDVLAQDGLPPKREVVVYAGMSSLQRSFYELAGKNALREALVRYHAARSAHKGGAVRYPYSCRRGEGRVGLGRIG